jgi:hypothetical protein
MITYCFQYFSLCLGGIILELIFRNKNNDKNRTFSIKLKKTDQTDTLRSSSISTNYIFNDKNKQNDLKYFLRIFFVYSLYYFAKITMSSLDNMGYNRVKYWPLEFIFLYLFAKRVMHKILYRHQILSLGTLMLACITIYVINSFIPQSSKDCSSLEGEEYDECKLLSVNIYSDISNKFGWYLFLFLSYCI